MSEIHNSQGADDSSLCVRDRRVAAVGDIRHSSAILLAMDDPVRTQSLRTFVPLVLVHTHSKVTVTKSLFLLQSRPSSSMEDSASAGHDQPLDFSHHHRGGNGDISGGAAAQLSTPLQHHYRNILGSTPPPVSPSVLWAFTQMGLMQQQQQQQRRGAESAAAAAAAAAAHQQLLARHQEAVAGGTGAPVAGSDGNSSYHSDSHSEVSSPTRSGNPSPSSAVNKSPEEVASSTTAVVKKEPSEDNSASPLLKQALLSPPQPEASTTGVPPPPPAFLQAAAAAAAARGNPALSEMFLRNMAAAAAVAANNGTSHPSGAKTPPVQPVPLLPTRPTPPGPDQTLNGGLTDAYRRVQTASDAEYEAYRDKCFRQFASANLGRKRTPSAPYSAPSNSNGKQDKDEAYWARRRKNNEAAKRSRDARRQKEQEVAIRCKFLEEENVRLKQELAAALAANVYTRQTPSTSGAFSASPATE